MGCHGDRQERDATVCAGAAQGLPRGKVQFRFVGDDEGTLLAPPGGAQALYLSSGWYKGLVRYRGRTNGLFTAPADAPEVVQGLATGGLTKRYRPPAQGFARKYADVALLAESRADIGATGEEGGP